jgi:glycosyltransferase involved in cell wall biosynthesis
MKISVIIPVYNAKKYVSKAVDSALQFKEVEEIILIEDGSPDNALIVCRELAQKHDRVQLFQHPDKKNHGAGSSRNLGIEKASKDFIAFLDADDYFLPNRFDAEKELFKDPEIEGVFNAIGTEFLTEKGKEDFLSNINDNHLLTVNYPAEGHEVFRGLLGKHLLHLAVFSLWMHLQ